MEKPATSSGFAPTAQAQLQELDEFQITPDTCAIIAAGGSGVRFGDPRGKQFVDLCGLPLISWSLLAFDEAPSISSIVIVCATERMDEMRSQTVDILILHTPVYFAPSGTTRQESCYSGLLRAPQTAKYVAIHDSARPLITPEGIEDTIARVRAGADGALLAHPATDTLKVVKKGCVVQTPDRSPYWYAQTPQVFGREAILKAHKQARTHHIVATDDASLMEHLGARVEVVSTPAANLKVTVPEDLILAEAVLLDRFAKAATGGEL
ncbi:2-C-methyl-D-erythritol 4-phosphate cytidylyltransferase [Atopobium fossor]|uniref:2-C-methyl-D-erythritol 4-phosphate cytidylyltransferase n=1 Tax=Atopobium fossor TaxID=39487 RepID=UPI001FE17F7C|nr:2-C-methyl-D-erythritol 4-phosphate cytidylyltransferase [Atopobium fossor]